MLVNRADRYYLLPVGWQADTDAVYVIRESADTRVEPLPGTQP